MISEWINIGGSGKRGTWEFFFEKNPSPVVAKVPMRHHMGKPQVSGKKGWRERLHWKGSQTVLPMYQPKLLWLCQKRQLRFRPWFGRVSNISYPVGHQSSVCYAAMVWWISREKKKYVSQNPSKRYPVCILDSSVARSENMFSNLFFSAKDFGIHTESKRQQLVRIRSNKTLGSINQRPWGWHRISRGFKSSINSLSTYSPEHEGLEPQNHPKMKRKLICSIFVFQRCHNWRQCSKCQKPGRSGFM